MDEAADRDRTGQRRPTAPSDEQRHRERLHEQAEQIAVEGDDLSEVFYSVLGRERPHVGEPPPAGASWPPPLGDRSASRNHDRPDEV